MEFDPDAPNLDLLQGVIDPDAVQMEVAPDDEADAATGAAVRVLRRIEDAYAAGNPQLRIPCPFCGRPLRYRKDEHGCLAECPGNDFVCMG
ncbi:MAG TPA: hypothetical protein GX715_06010 [Armatimonadetes bacterium]|jgi:hypothetical protein|nr:hypothetical protein [Armatimonadota bacterium]